MNYLSKLKPMHKLQIGIVIFGLATISGYVLWNYKLGFLGGVITGLLAALGLGLLATYKKK